MSFNRINNPNKREDEVKKFLALKETLRNRDRAEKMGVMVRDEEIAKMFKPVTAATSQLEKKLSEKIEKLPGGIAQALPAPAVPYSGVLPPQLEEIEGATGESLTVPGDPELSGYLSTFANPKQAENMAPLIKIESGEGGAFIMMGDKPLTIEKDKIKYNGKTYNRTPELMDLIFSINPKKENTNKEGQAYKDYYKIIIDSAVLPTKSTIKTKTGEIKNVIVPNQSIIKRLKDKWEKVLKEIWIDYKKSITGTGILDTTVKLIKKYKEAKQKRKQKGTGNSKKTIVLLSDPETLADRLDLLCGSAQAGNTGLKNEMVEICNELIRMKAMTRKQRDQLLYDV